MAFLVKSRLGMASSSGNSTEQRSSRKRRNRKAVKFVQFQSKHKRKSRSPINRRKSVAEEEPQLPERWVSLERLFCYLEISVRILKLKQECCRFNSIKSKVEMICDRKIKPSQIAQMKFLLRELLDVKKVMFRKPESLIMEPDLVIDFQMDSPACLVREFHQRLLQLFLLNPELDDIPEAVLPEPFSRKTIRIPPQWTSPSGWISGSPIVEEIQIPSTVTVQRPLNFVSHFPVNFKRHFSRGQDRGNETFRVQSSESDEDEPLQSLLNKRESERPGINTNNNESNGSKYDNTDGYNNVNQKQSANHRIRSDNDDGIDTRMSRRVL